MNGIVAFSLKQRVPMVLLFVMILFGGVIAFRERYITIPIEVNVATAPHLTAMRTISLFGLSDVKLQFSFDFTYEQALQQVLNRLSQMPTLPNNAQPKISPVSPIGEIYRYRLVGPPGYSVLDLKTLQDWVLQRRFRGAGGHRRHRMGRQDQNLRTRGRFQQADCLRADAAAAAAGAE